MEIIWLGNILGYGTSFFGNVYGIEGVSPCIQSRDYKGPRMILVKKMKNQLIMLGNINMGGKGQFGYTYYEQGLAPTIAAGTHGYCIGHILVEKKNETDISRRFRSNELWETV